MLIRNISFLNQKIYFKKSVIIVWNTHKNEKKKKKIVNQRNNKHISTVMIYGC